QAAIQIKGTRQGLLLVIREDAEVSNVMKLVEERFRSDASFLSGASLFVDLGWREADARFFEALEDVFERTSVTLAGVLSTSNRAREEATARGHKAIIGRLGLSEHQGRRLKEKPPEQNQIGVTITPSQEGTLAVEEATTPVAEEPEVSVPPPFASEERESEATLYIRRTMRSGARAMYPGNIVVMGDVNPGAEIEAEGDIIVIGNLRGKAHAGSGGNAAAQVWSLALQPIQLRIADHVWVGGADKGKSKSLHRNVGPHRAIVQDGQVAIVGATQVRKH
ncbi:unnamed protein product, partial [Phaeothamnion confervicola]